MVNLPDNFLMNFFEMPFMKYYKQRIDSKIILFYLKPI